MLVMSVSPMFIVRLEVRINTLAVMPLICVSDVLELESHVSGFVNTQIQCYFCVLQQLLE